MFIKGGAVNKNIVEEDDNKMAKIRLEYEIHGGLKGRRAITQPKRHDLELIMAMVGVKCCFGNVIGVHADLVVSLQ